MGRVGEPKKAQVAKLPTRQIPTRQLLGRLLLPLRSHRLATQCARPAGGLSAAGCRWPLCRALAALNHRRRNVEASSLARRERLRHATAPLTHRLQLGALGSQLGALGLQLLELAHMAHVGG